MKLLQKVLGMVAAVVTALALCSVALADDVTGSITINNGSATGSSVAGKTFKAYKLLDVSYFDEDGNGSADSYVYVVPEEYRDFFAGKFGVSKDAGNFDYLVTEAVREMVNEDISSNVFTFAADAWAMLKANNVAPTGTATAGADASSVKISDLPLGYYIVVEEEGGSSDVPISALMLQTTNPDAMVNLKASKPGLDKVIVEGETTTDYSNGSIGDVVNYQLNSTVPVMIGYSKYFFVVNDTMSAGLTFKNDVAIVIGDGANKKNLVPGTDFTVSSSVADNGVTSIEIVFTNFIQYKDRADEPIAITYSATINSNAVIGTAGNPNTADLVYSNNPNQTPSGDPDNPDKPGQEDPTGKTPEEIVYTYVTGIELLKVDPEGKSLTGAEFRLTGEKVNQVVVDSEVFTEDANGTYWKLKDGTYTTTAPTETGDADDNSDAYESTTVKYSKTGSHEVKGTGTTQVDVTGTVGSDGVLRFDGLGAGEYQITEIKAPAGFNLLDAPIELRILWGAPENGSTECTWAFSRDGGVGGVPINPANGIANLTVVNQAGALLPSTGGMGTTLFYIVGGVIVAGAVVALIVRSKRARNR